MATNLEFIKSASATGGVTSLSVTDCFSDRFDVYMISITTTNLNNTTHLYMRLLDSSNTEISANEYDNANLQMHSASAFSEQKNTNDTEFQYMGSYAGSEGLGLTIYVFNPFDSSSYTFVQRQSVSYGTNMVGYKSIGMHKSAEQCKGVLFTEKVTNSLNDIKVNVYGVK